jgi:DNA-binding CsgD family transcriptional regulator
VGVKSLHLSEAGVSSILCDHDAMVVWEAVRLRRHGASIAELAGSLALPLASVQRAVDALAALGMLLCRRAGRGRRVPTYRVAMPQLRVRVDGVPAAEIDAFARRLQQSCSEILERAAGPSDGAGPNSQRWVLGFGHARLTAAEHSRVRSLIETICDIVHAARCRQPDAAQVAEDGGIHRPSDAIPAYGLLVRFEPLADLPPPHPRITLAHDGDGPVPVSNGRLSLSPRERQVAEALAIGMSRPVVAVQLGVSANTVATLSRRVYSKLGIRSRAELARALAAHPG